MGKAEVRPLAATGVPASHPRIDGVKVLPRRSGADLGLNHALRQAGYTTGDRLVVLLERDYQHVCEVAQHRITPMWQIAAYIVEQPFLDRIKSAKPL